MKSKRGTARVVVTTLVAGLSLPAAAAPTRTIAAPRPVIANPNAPQADVQQPQTAQYTSLAFTLTTGDDDLRTDSAAWVTMTFPDRTSQQCVLRTVNEDTWSNNTTHQAPQCVLASPKTFDELKSSKILLSYGSAIPSGVMGGAGDFLHTTDNWNVNEVRIEGLNATQHTQRCVIDATGNPLVRMKASLTSYDVSAAPTTC